MGDTIVSRLRTDLEPSRRAKSSDLCPRNLSSNVSRRQREHDAPGREAALGPGDELERWSNFGPDESWQHLRKLAFDRSLDIVGSAHAEDIAQATLAAYGLAREIIRNPEAWVTRVARNLSINFKHRRRREFLVEPDVLQGLGEAQPNDRPDEIDRLVAAILFEEMMDRLPDKQRATLKLQYGLGLKQAQIAEILGVTIETVKEHRERALDHLRREVRRDVEESYDKE
jgi:RNA polymerase sigma factor (sigma-70 family)